MLGRKDLITVLLAVFMTTPVLAIAPVVKTVPAIADNPTIPHDALPDKAVTLKGTSSVQGPGIQATWDFGDGSSPFVSNIANQYDVSTTHTYSGAPGSIFAATLTVLDTRTGESSSSIYRVGIREKSVETEVSVALDEALWYLHKTMNRTQSGVLTPADGAELADLPVTIQEPSTPPTPSLSNRAGSFLPEIPTTPTPKPLRGP